jgi:hypothetical protein
MHAAHSSSPKVEVLPPLSGRRPGSAAREGVDPALDDVSRWMDTQFEIPGLGIRFGLDAILGLLPGLGDTLTSLVSFYILSAGVRHGVPRITLARMGLNIAIDWIVGAIPLVGDLFDVAWKSNTKNVELIRRHVGQGDSSSKARLADWLLVGGMIVGLLAILAVSLFVAWTILSWLVAQLSAAAS